MKTLRLLLGALLSAVFAFAAVAKIADPRAFFDAIQSYRLLPWLPSAIVAVWLPWIELVLAASLWVRGVGRVAAGMLAMLNVLFLIALVQAWARGIDITCGCFGGAAVVHGGAYVLYLARDVALIAAAGVFWRLKAEAAPDAPTPP